MAQATLVVVKHPPEGEGPVGVALCAEIRALLPREASQVVVFHDATEMAHATTDYARAFMKLDADLGDRVAQIVCAIPRPIPRMMAWTVAVASSREWKIFKSAEEASAHLKAAGFTGVADLVSNVRVRVT